ncbi:DUF5990 family protein [Streptomyces mirabilis]|uniref:DUF5990 family protein n=1 Tax=Streptomyces TaxID=1883 RepID=UPI0039F5727C
MPAERAAVRLLLPRAPAAGAAAEGGARVNPGLLVGRLGLTDPRGNPLCARVVPPAIIRTAAMAD